MLYLALLTGNNSSKTILASRNAHKVFTSACALLDLKAEWLYSESDNIISCEITAETLEKKLSEMEEKPLAFYITSPDYLGNVADIKSLSKVCNKYGILFICDNAHGAYLNFLEENIHPISLGAHICCDSAHKTLPVLTGGGYLHISKNAPKKIADNAERAMSLFASTSPSYLILQSLDNVNAYLNGKYASDLKTCISKIEKLKNVLTNHGYTLTGNEKTKITISTKSYGYKGTEISEYLEKLNVFCEFCDPDYIVLMFTPCTDDNTFEVLEKALLSLERKDEIKSSPPIFKKSKQVISPRKAIFSETEIIPVKNASGRILASENVACPPAIPIVICGEEISENDIGIFEYYGIQEVEVIR
jgi:arginine/lysine/ornithine decarboxylase